MANHLNKFCSLFVSLFLVKRLADQWVGGSWMVPQALVAAGHWAEITALSAEAMTAVTGVKKPFLNQPAHMRGEG